MWSGIFTGILLLVFLGIVFWAWSSKRRDDFEEAAQLPLDEEDRDDRRNDSSGNTQ